MEIAYYYTGLIVINLFALIGVLYFITFAIKMILNYLGDNLGVLWNILDYKINRKEFKSWKRLKKFKNKTIN